MYTEIYRYTMIARNVLDIPYLYIYPYTGVFPKTSFIFQDEG